MISNSSRRGVALILAAGVAKRFGSDKRLFNVGNKPLVIKTIEVYAEIFARIAVVIRPNDPLESHLPGFCECICADQAARGQAYSLRAGISALTDEDAATVALADMPFVLSTTLATVRDQLLNLSTKSIVRPLYHGQAGQPVGFKNIHFEHLLALQGDQGAREYIRSRAQEVEWITVDDPGVCFDIDTPQDLEHQY